MFSIITPTYNREDTLHRVYDSLRSQSYTKFQWIVIDDGSTDGTQRLMASWMKEVNDFEIQYHQLPENKGKPYALNFGFHLCTGDYTIIADSDDSFRPNTLSDLKEIWCFIDRTNPGSNIGAIWTLVEDENNNIIGEKFPKDFWQVNLKERVLNRKNPVLGEKWHSWKTDVLKKYQMYHNDNSFVSESATWTRINKDFDYLCLNIVHRKYWYSGDGLIHQKKSKLKNYKISYYTSFYQLQSTSNRDICSQPYYRNLAFEFIKSTYYYSDPLNKLNSIKKILCWLIFIYKLPRALMSKLM